MIEIATINFIDLYRFGNEERIEWFENIIIDYELNPDIYVLPAGILVGDYTIDESLEMANSLLSKILLKNHCKGIVCLGIDIKNKKYQLGIACDKNGIIAVGRKFYQTSTGISNISLASSYIDEELQFSRIFELKQTKFYLAVCYDIFGIRHLGLDNPGCDVIINVVHGFNPKGYGNSGEVDFARKGFARAGYHWNSYVFGAADFTYRKIPINWPTGILVNKQEANLKKWKYIDNIIKPVRIIQADDEEDLVKIYKIG